jgi:hypothetical protein
MTEEEFVALLAIEGKKLVVDRSMSRGNYKNKPVPYYAVGILDPNDGKEWGFFGNMYRSRNYAIQKAIKDYYEDN